MNQYPAWKYTLIALVIAIGALYALPNLYGEAPALQITSSRGFQLPDELPAEINNVLTDAQLAYKSSEQIGNKLLYRLNSPEDQLKAADAVREGLGEQYVVALNLAHATPDWSPYRLDRPTINTNPRLFTRILPDHVVIGTLRC